MGLGANSIRERNKRLKRVQAGLEEPRRYENTLDEAIAEAGLNGEEEIYYRQSTGTTESDECQSHII